MKLEGFKIRSPNFAIHEKGKWSLAELDDEDFDTYLNEFGWALKNRRAEQIKLKNDAILGAAE